jgi:hypothetical protein
MQLALFDFDHALARYDTRARFLRTVATPRRLARARSTVGPWLPGFRPGVASASGIHERWYGGVRQA